jgi:3-oxoacyl-[acyl-carrier protein] reductase
MKRNGGAVALMSLKGKRVFVAGGTGKIGEALLRALSREGARVYFSYCTGKERAEALARDLALPKPIFLDVGDSKAAEEARDATLETLQGVDALVNATGVWVRAPLERATAEEMEHVFRVNLLGPLYLVKAFLPALRANQEGGSVVLFGSSGRELEAPSQSFYAASKAGVTGMVRALAFELAPMGVRINAVAPRYVLSIKKAEEKRLKESTLPLIARSFSHPMDVAEVVKFLISEESGIVSGQTIELEVSFGYSG